MKFPRLAVLLMLAFAFAGTAAGQDASDKALTLAFQGIDAEGKGDYDQAMKLFNEALLLAPGGKTEARLHTERGNIYLEKKEYDAAIKDYDEAVRLYAVNAAAFAGRGDAYEMKGDHDKALADCNEAIRFDPKDAAVYVTRAAAYNGKGMHDKAIADCNTALGINPHSADAYEARGIGYDGEGRSLWAVEDFSKVIELNPKCAEAYLKRGGDYGRAGMFDRALADFTTAIQIDPKYGIACNELAWLLATCPQAEFRDGKKAVECARRACELSQWQRPAEVDTLAAAYAEAGDFDSAVKFEQWYLAFPGVGAKDGAGAKARIALYQAHKAYHEAGKQ